MNKNSGTAPDVESEISSIGKINAEKVLPINPAVYEKFRVAGSGKNKTYFFKDSDKEAFQDKGSRITTKSNSTLVAGTIVEIAESKGWDSIRVTGKDNFKRAIWLEASSKGLKVDGYKPTEPDLYELDQLKGKQNTIVNTSKGTENAPGAGTESESPSQLAPENQTAPIKPEKHDETKPDGQGVPAHSDSKQRVAGKRRELWEQEIAGQESETTSKKTELEVAYKSLPQDEAIKAHPELADLYKIESAAMELANKRIGNPESREQYLDAIRQRSLNELAKGNPLPNVPDRQVAKEAAKQAAPER